MSSQIEKYGLTWSSTLQPLRIELEMIKQGGTIRGQGLGLYEHYKNAMTMLWPEDDWHEWAVMAIQTFAENDITVLIGPSDAGKTYPTAKWLLVEYWCASDQTLCLVSSTDIRGLELRVWGQLKALFNRAKERFDWLPGFVLESTHCITTDEISDDNERARVLLKGIVCIPCLQGGRYVGIGKYHGIKSPRLRQASDESQLMGPSHLDALPNYLGKNYKGAFLGNPIDPMDPLGIIAEPKCGWTNMPEPTKTTSWPIKFHSDEGVRGTCVNFVGTDSPNFKRPKTEPIQFPYLINWKKIEAVKALFGEDSYQYYSQCIGVMKTGLLGNRIITRDFCKEHHAQEKAIWGTGFRKKIYATDAAWGGVGGDRCVAGYVEFGEDNNGVQVLRVNPPVIVPVSVRINKDPADQIAEFTLANAANDNIPPEDMFYDSTGRGTLGPAYARACKTGVPNPVEFGGKPTERPVRHDLFVYEGEPGHVTKRLKTCREQYVDFVSELWFSARYIILCDQMRELPEDVMNEGCGRCFGVAPGNKEYIESKHNPKDRKKMMRSPDLFDWLVTCIEGCRQRGFKIQKLGNVEVVGGDPYRWLADEQRRYIKTLRSKQLTGAR